MLQQFFAVGPWPEAGAAALHHSAWLVALSVALAVACACVALHLAGLAQQASAGWGRRIAVGSGMLALGTGIWSMHFVGMLAFDLCASGAFDPWITAVSMVPGLLAAWVAMRVLLLPQARLRILVPCGALVGAGIGVMHYTGMAASQFAPLMRYGVGGFALSIGFAVVMATLALWCRFRLASAAPRLPRGAATALAGAVLGLAIAGMHYISVLALRLMPLPVAVPADALQSDVSADHLALAVALVALVVGAAAAAINMHLRLRQLLRQANAGASRLAALVDTAVDGIVIINARGQVQLFNAAAERLLGWSAGEVIGRNVNMLMPAPHRQAHDGYLQRHLRTGHASIIGAGREIQALHKGGHLVDMRLAVGRVDEPGEPLFVGFLTDLTERRRLESARERGQEQLRSLVGNLPGVAFRCRNAPDWPMEFISEAVQVLTGWSAEDFLQGRMSFERLLHPGDAGHIAMEMEYALRLGQPYQIEYRITTRDGRRRWVSEYGRGVQGADGAVHHIDGVMLDITEAKSRNAEFSGTVAAINRSHATAEFDLQGQLIAANAPYLTLMGYTFDEVLGRPHAFFCAPQDAHGIAQQALWRSLAQGEFVAGEFRRLGRDGREVWLHATYNPIFDAEGKVFKVIQFATDLSERRAMEQDLRAAKERAEAAAAARSTFLANMSHEIRTPMNAIIGFTEALLDSSLEPTQRRHLGTVHHAGRSMLRLLNDILDTAKLEKGAVELELAPFSLRQLCQQILASLRIIAARKGLELVLDYPAGLPEHWQGDAFRLQQVLVNLMGNAIKFTLQGQVTLRVSGSDGALCLDVVDTGIGMDEAALQRVFEPFSQADASTTRRYGGTGLGTTIARQLTELMGGILGAQSRPGEGSTFSVRLPLQAAAPPPGEATAQRGQEVRVLPRLRILAVDDVPANLELLQLLLARGGHRVVQAPGGAEALQAFERERFDVVLMDLQMPDMDGLQATRAMRAFEQSHGRRATAIVALSASVLEQDRRNARAAGMDGFANKPLEPRHLIAEMARVLHLPPLPQPQPLQPSTPAPLQPPTAIDWERGMRLWTQAHFLRAAIERFMQEAPGQLARLRAAVLTDDSEAVEALAHRMRGAAANLALPGVEQHALHLEQAAGPPGAGGLMALLATLEAALAEVPAALGCSDAPDATPAHAPVAPQRLDGAACAAVRDAIDALAPALASGEWPQAPLDTLEQHLGAAHLGALRDALERFDFDQARTHLQSLRGHVWPECF